MHNCCLVNLEDMLQNGTVVSGTMIEKPHSFSTACNIATQIIAQVASNQYGGQTISLSHLAPFVDISRQKIRAEVFEDVNCDCGCKLSDEDKVLRYILKKSRFILWIQKAMLRLRIEYKQMKGQPSKIPLNSDILRVDLIFDIGF